MGRMLQREAGANSTMQPAAPARMVDREADNRWYRWLIHVGGPVGASLMVHGVLIVALTLLTVGISRPPRTEYIMDTPPIVLRDSSGKAGTERFEWPSAQPLPDLTIESTGSVDIPTPSIEPLEIAEQSGIPDFPSFADGRMGILGTGTGAGLSGEGGLGLGPRRTHYEVDTIAGTLRAKSVVYVIDFSGSTIVVQDDLVRSLKRAVSKLKAQQVFDVVLFYTKASGVVQSDSFAGELRSADKAAKEAFFGWIETKSPQGSTEPLGAMRVALRLEPEAIIFLSDGMFDDSIVDAITKSNRRRRSRIECLVLDEMLLNAPTNGLVVETDGVKRLQRLAAQNGGTAAIVTGADLGP